jgi:hypothetical protein
MQEQLDRFLKTQRDEQKKWQREIEQRIDRQFRELRQGTQTHDRLGRDARPEQDRQPENSRRTVTCYT